MQKVIIDTNVIISGLIQFNLPYQLLNHIVDNKEIQICLSKEILNEYIEVTSRPKFTKYENFDIRALLIIKKISLIANIYIPEIKIDFMKDIDDNIYLELAEISKADFIITGNTNDFTFSKYNNTKIVTPFEYWNNYKI